MGHRRYGHQAIESANTDPHQAELGGEMGVKIDAVHWLDLLTRPSVYQPRADGGGVELSSANRTISIG